MGVWRSVAGSQGAESSGCDHGSDRHVDDLRAFERSHKGGALGGVTRAVRGVFSHLRVALSRPVRPSLLLQKDPLNSTYASLDDLEILTTIGAWRAFCHRTCR